MVSRRDDIPVGDGPPRGHRRQVLTSLADLESVKEAFSDEEADDETDDPKDPERVIGGHKAHATQLQHRLDAVKEFLLREFGIDIGDIQNDSELTPGSSSAHALTRHKTELADATTETYRWKNISQNLQGNLQELWRDMVSLGPDGTVWWSGFMGLIADLQLNHPESLKDLEEYLRNDPEEGSRQPVGILERFWPRSQDEEAAPRPVTPLEKVGGSTDGGFVKRTFGFDFGRKSRSNTEK